MLKYKMNKTQVIQFIKHKYIYLKNVWSYCIYTKDNTILEPNVHILYKNGLYKQCLFYEVFKDGKSFGWKIKDIKQTFSNGVLSYCSDIQLLYYLNIVETNTPIKDYYWIHNCNYQLDIFDIGELFFSSNEWKKKLITIYVESFIKK